MTRLHHLTRATTIIAICAACLATTPITAEDVDPFYAQRLEDGIRAYQRGDHQRASEELRIAAFGLLSTPDRLATALAHLALAQSANDNREGFELTYERLAELEGRFKAYSRAALTAELRAVLDQAASPLPPLHGAATARTGLEIEPSPERAELEGTFAASPETVAASTAPSSEPTEQVAGPMNPVGGTEARASCSSEEQHIAELQTEVDSWRKRSTETDSRAAELSEQIVGLTARIELANSDARSLNEPATKRITELQDEVSGWRSQAFESDRRASTLAEASTVADERAAALEEEIQTRIAEEAQLRTRLEQAEAETATVTSRLEETQRSMELANTTYVVTARANPCLNLRRAPGAGSLDCLAPGTRLALLELQPEWARARLADGTEGWASLAFIEPSLAKPPEVEALEVARVELAASRAEAEQLQRALEDAIARAESSKQAELDLQTLVDQADGQENAQLAELNERFEQAAAALDTAMQDKTALESQLLEATSNTDELRSRLGSQTVELARWEERLTSATASQADRETLVGELQQRLDIERQELESVQLANAELDRRLATANAREVELTEARAMIGELQSRLLESELKRDQLAPATPDSEAREAIEVAAAPAPVAAGPAGVASEHQPDAADLIALTTLVQDWARAWSEQRVDEYLSFYSVSFEPANGAKRSEWADLRRRRLMAPAFVEIELSELDPRTDDPDLISIRFLQTYHSNTFSDTVRKVLSFAREDGAWKISSEISEPVEHPVQDRSVRSGPEHPEGRSIDPRTEQRGEPVRPRTPGEEGAK